MKQLLSYKMKHLSKIWFLNISQVFFWAISDPSLFYTEAYCTHLLSTSAILPDFSKGRKVFLFDLILLWGLLPCVENIICCKNLFIYFFILDNKPVRVGVTIHIGNENIGMVGSNLSMVILLEIDRIGNLTSTHPFYH